ncbi:hypothetical protein D4T97_002680 [Siminovitchia acidinfaciens]|uniref:Uncharacterized protein n=1 Tax=Siminovitchia acidinfaciens TaxID=2321395 RepID=A0A429Y7M4_9BACI|nr:hypothetical protein [Siminovitchia acidinfaciens]RST77410.1 hypothetical protein D4T97_002680 [Siminovitchia acidinfaciens]
MNLSDLRNELAIKNKNGISFLSSAVVVWTIITIIFLLPLEMSQKNIFMLFSSGIMFPLAIALSKLYKVDWKSKGLPLSDLGLGLNLAQLMYFPILFLVFAHSPSDMIAVFAIITAAHLYPYGWLYQANAYYVYAPMISVLIMILGFSSSDQLWVIPLVMAGSLVLLNLTLFTDYKKKLSYRRLSA